MTAKRAVLEFAMDEGVRASAPSPCTPLFSSQRGACLGAADLAIRGVLFVTTPLVEAHGSARALSETS